jgi:hypothetical protein
MKLNKITFRKIKIYGKEIILDNYILTFAEIAKDKLIKSSIKQRKKNVKK